MTGQAKDARRRRGGSGKGARAGARLEWVDVAKGLGIILVVIAHAWTQGRVRDTIYAFHMPLFFVLSGYVARPHPMGDFLRRQIRSMLVPYIAFLLTLAAADQLIEHMRGHAPMFRSWGAAAHALLLGGTELRGPFTIFWFVPCLMVARLIQNALSRFWPDPRDARWAVAMGCALIFGVWWGGRSDFSPLGLLSVPVALAFLWAGALWRTVPRDGMLATAALVAGAALLWWRVPVPLNMKIGDYGTPGWSLALALLLSVGLGGAARLLALLPAEGLGLAALGRMSLVIMYCHVAVLHYGAPYWSRTVGCVMALLLPVLLYHLLGQVGWGRRYYLGRRAG